MRFSGYRSKADLLGDTQADTCKVIAHATIEYTTAEGDRIIRYQNTDIVTVKPNRYMILNSGGYRTPTTKNRINDHLDKGVLYQEKSVWYYKPGRYWSDGKTPVVFYDGITLNTRGNVTGRKPNAARIEKATAQMKAKIKTFVNRLDSMDTIPMPSNADCWDCSMQDADGTPLGDLSNSDHLKNHIFEGYMHGSLLVNAMRNHGYTDQQIGLHYGMDWRDTFKRALRKYLVDKLLH